MNIALGAFILTLLFLPAISFRMAINREENLKELLSSLTFTDSIWVFSLIPILIHVGLLGLLTVLHVQVKYDLILNILYSNKDYHIENGVFGSDVLRFLSYCFIGILAGYVLGMLMNRLEASTQILTRLLGLGNEWYEVFEGIVFDPVNGEKRTRNVDIIYVNILSGTKESTILYSGVLVNYYYKPRSSELDYLVLQKATRRDLRKEYISNADTATATAKINYYSAATSKPVKIPGEYFIIPVREILNINVSYISIATEGNGGRE